MARGLVGDGKKVLLSRAEQINAAVDAQVNGGVSALQSVKPKVKVKPKAKVKPIVQRTAAQEQVVRAGNAAVNNAAAAAKRKNDAARAAFMAAEEAKYKRPGL